MTDSTKKITWILAAALFISMILLVFLSFFQKNTQSISTTVQPTSQPAVVPQAGAESKVAAIPENETITVGETVVFDIVIDSGANLVNGAQLEMQYDPTVLRITKVTEGDFFESPIEYANNINQTTGEITYAVGSFTENSGTGVVAKVEGQALSKTNGKTEVLMLKPTTIIMELENSQSVLKEAKGASLVIR